jgi:hypothetical protein
MNRNPKHPFEAVVSVARSIVTYQVGLPVGCIRMQRALSQEALAAGSPSSLQESGVERTLFDGYLSETAELPLGHERLECAREYLERVDPQLEQINSSYRDRVFNACYELIDRFGSEVDAARGERRPAQD